MTDAVEVCYRCGRPGYVDWVDITTLVDPEPVYWPSLSYCLTDGCTDLDGSRRLQPLTPEELRRREEDTWLARHRQMAERT